MAEDILECAADDEPVALEEFLSASGLLHHELVELVEIGVVQPAGATPVWTFHSRTIVQVRRVVRLRDDFGLNAAGMALALTYLERIETLEARLRQLEASQGR